MKKTKKFKKTSQTIKSAIMDKVKIKRVKREKKKVSTKEKILAGIGVGSTLLGAAAPFAPKTSQTQFVRTQSGQKTSTAAGKVKAALSRFFGVSTAKASVTREYLDTLGADVTAAKTALASFDQ
ncbi:MAG: hypothetical protein AAB729_02775, partial [Patescibacteria group bacterium]